MKKIMCYILKCIISGVIACAVLSVFALVYYNPPVAITQGENVTNFKYIPNKNWSYMLEGFGYGTTDGCGYNNAYNKDSESPDIVFMGSSQMEALQVPERNNFVYLLNERLNSDNRTDNDFFCYNLGISEHFFEVSVSNVRYAAEKYKGAKYIVLEAFDVEFDNSQLDKMLNGEYHNPMAEKGFVHTMVRKVPYIRLLYKKLSEVSPAGEQSSLIAEGGEDKNIDTYRKKISIILKNISDICKSNGSEAVVLIHDRISFDQNGKAGYCMNTEYLGVFKECAEENGIKVIDAHPRFREEYEKSYRLPHGYANTTPGNGHLNKMGHMLVADELYEKINEFIR